MLSRRPGVANLILLALSLLVIAHTTRADAAVRPVVAAPIIPSDLGPVADGGSEGDRKSGESSFSLRHILHHGAAQYPGMLRRLDVPPEALIATEDDPTLRPRPIYQASSHTKPITRLQDRTRDTIETYLFSQRAGYATSLSAESFNTSEITQPNVTDKDTVLSLSKIAADAYIETEHTENWLDAGTPYNYTDDFGWEGDGLRGHIFANEDNSTVIIGLKGTSPAVFDGAETTTNDKVNDNLFFSCCCARISMWWSTVCDCYAGTAYTCNNTCVSDALMEEDKYYYASRQLYYNVSSMYPDSEIWLTGHSLGGAVSSLLGQTYGLPVVTFEAPGEALASERLGLPTPPGAARQNGEIGVYHFGHTADPIYMGACNGPTSACSIGGYAMETRCHAGMECTYDVVSDHGWRMGLGYHRIQPVIKDIIDVYDAVPECTYDPECADCWNWKDVTDIPTTTSSSTPTSTTSTTSCETPGWWGCRDPTTTVTTTSTSTGVSTTVTTTITCHSFGWFGQCLDPTTTATDVPSSTPKPTITSTTSIPSSTQTSTTTCETPGWFGCNDPTSTTTSTITPTTTAASATETVCRHPGMFWGCWDGPSATSTSSSAPARPTQSEDEGAWKCVKRALWGLGWCEEWKHVDMIRRETSTEL